MLPRVTRWSLLNEPNQPGWLTPQYERKRGRLVATAAVVYRALARAGIAGLRASGHGRDQVLLGETAPIGRFDRPAGAAPDPAASSSCASCSASRRAEAAARRRGRAAAARFKRFAVSGFAHHPYQRGGSRPPAEPPEAAGEITISSPARLRRVLDAGGAGAPHPAPAAGLLHRVRLPDQPARPHLRRARRRSSPPTSTSPTGWPTATGGCAAVGQYKLVDDASLPSFQSGLRFGDGRREAGLRGLPAADLGQRARVAAAGLRPGAPGRQRDAAAACRSRCGRRKGGAFATVRTVTVRSRHGQFLVRVPRRPGVWRLVWGALVSREARVAPR